MNDNEKQLFRRLELAEARVGYCERAAEHAQQFAAHTVAAALKQRDRAERLAVVFACIALGLLIGLLYAGSRLNQPQAPSELTGDPEVMQLEPTEVRRPEHQVYEL